MNLREIDKLVAEKVMGLTQLTYDWGRKLSEGEDEIKYQGMNWGRDGHPHYTTDITAAWEIVEKLNRPIRISNKTANHGIWWVYIEDVCATANTVPLAICLAALKAAGVTVDGEGKTEEGDEG